jgi:lathosterol oxidase
MALLENYSLSLGLVSLYLMLHDLLSRFLLIVSISSLRYVFFAGLTYSIFYVWKKNNWIQRKIQTSFPSAAHIKREVTYSLISFLIFGLIGTGIYLMQVAGITKIYTDFREHSIGYFIFSVVVFIAAHDLYFYITHRLMHHKLLYKHVHRIHHLSTNPTPWAAFAFHPLEAVVEIGILPVMVLIMPLHPLAIIAWILYMTLMNVIGHSGFEMFPKGFTTNSLTSWYNTSTHHNMHHKFVLCNYGLYFNIWDKLFKTNHAKYHETFEAIAGRDAEVTTQQELSERENLGMI